jgi:hypothetical protein
MLSEKSRSRIFTGFSPIVGEEAVGEMLAHYPATEGEQPVTKDHLDARLSELRLELHKGINRILIWVPTAMAAMSGLVVALVRVGT